MEYLKFFLREDVGCVEEYILDEMLSEWILDKETRREVDGAYEHSDRFKFGLTFKHLVNRIATADLSKHTLENTRASLQRTVRDCSSPKDVAFLRRDMQAGKILMRKIIENNPDREERNEAKRHLAWLEKEYAKMLSDRLREMKK